MRLRFFSPPNTRIEKHFLKLEGKQEGDTAKWGEHEDSRRHCDGGGRNSRRHCEGGGETAGDTAKGGEKQLERHCEGGGAGETAGDTAKEG